LSLAQPGRGLVVEGPSGIGKTTALKRAQEMLAKEGTVQSESVKILSARRPDDVALLSNLSNHHVGTVIVDDFHRLPKSTRDYLADYLKYLADYEDFDKKLVIAGIPCIGERLIEMSFDIATRLDIFRLGRVEDNLVLEMIEKGARALNVRFARPHEIAAAANGSLNVAQLLCFHLCALENVEKTQDIARAVAAPLEDAIARVMEQIEPKFGSTARVFASLGGRRDFTTIELLRQVSTTLDGYLSLRNLESERPDLADGIAKFLKHRQLERVYETVPDSKNFLLFEPDAAAIVIDDPNSGFFSHTRRVSGCDSLKRVRRRSEIRYL
jgi:AcrR family transcriptional regulator